MYVCKPPAGPPWSVTDDDRCQTAKRHWPPRAPTLCIDGPVITGTDFIWVKCHSYHPTVSNHCTTPASWLHHFFIHLQNPQWKRIGASDLRIHLKQVCVGLQSDRSTAAGCVRKPRWVFPAAMPHPTSHASNTRFYPHTLLLTWNINHTRHIDRPFSVCEVFRSHGTDRRQNVAIC